MIYVVILVAIVLVAVLMLSWSGTSAYRHSRDDSSVMPTLIPPSDGQTHYPDCGHDAGGDASGSDSGTSSN